MLPPEMSLCGARPSQEQKCLLVGKRDMSVPISDMMVWANDEEPGNADDGDQIDAQDAHQVRAHVVGGSVL